MPKEPYSIKRFDGGVNNQFDPRDIKDNEASSINNADVSQIGRLKTLTGADVTAYTSGATLNFLSVDGYGFFRFKSDYKYLSANNTLLTTPTVVSGGVEYFLYFYQNGGQLLQNTPSTPYYYDNIVYVGGAGSARKIIFTNVDGSIFCADTGFGTTYSVLRKLNYSLFAFDGTVSGYLSWPKTYEKLSAVQGGKELPPQSVNWGYWYKLEEAGSNSRPDTLTTGTITTVLQHDIGDGNDHLDAGMYRIGSSGTVTRTGGGAAITDARTAGKPWFVLEYNSNAAYRLGGIYSAYVTTPGTIVVGTNTDTGNWGNASGDEIRFIPPVGGVSFAITKMPTLYAPSGGGINTSDIINRKIYFRYCYEYSDKSLGNLVEVKRQLNSSSKNITITGGNSDHIDTFPYEISNTGNGQDLLVTNCTAHGPFPDNVIGFRLFYTWDTPFKTDASEWRQVAQFDLQKGQGRITSEDTWTNFESPASQYTYTDTGDQSGLSTGHIIWWDVLGGFAFKHDLLTYEDIAPGGFEFTDIKYKTACMANRRLYIANVSYTDLDGNSVRHGDRIIKSNVNQFESFKESGIIDITVNDGDEIIKIEEFADRILQFKTNTVDILNIAQDIEFVEHTIKGDGVISPNHVCKTSYGIVWITKRGCFMYDGRSVVNLMENAEGQNRISYDYLQASITGVIDDTILGYARKTNSLLVFRANTNQKSMHYSFDTKGWSLGTKGSASNHSNFVENDEGELLYMIKNSKNIASWDGTTTASASFSWHSKDIDFGFPGVRKTIYSVAITYRSATAPNLTPNFQVNGVDTDLNFATAITTAASEWTRVVLIANDKSEWKNIYSFKLIIDGTATDFEVNDITITYRLKTPR
tara:strand:- start:1065 stop:3653 length:2589 start_codon:yes stop_codon:yes gene_type:complete